MGSVLTAYRAMEDHQLGASPMRGTGGLLGITVDETDNELADRVFAAGKEMGWRRVADINESDDERIGHTPSTVRHGRRTSAATAFLRPAVRDGSVDLVTGTRVARVLFDGDKASGVEALKDGAPVEYRARREVVLAAGTIETPALLERSGIGRPDHLRRLGVGVRVAAPPCGRGRHRALHRGGASAIHP